MTATIEYAPLLQPDRQSTAAFRQRMQMNIFQAIGSVVMLVFGTANRAEQEREQQGPEGRAYDDALKKSCDAYYKEHGTNAGWEFDDKTLKGNE